jgi:AAA domain
VTPDAEGVAAFALSRVPEMTGPGVFGADDWDGASPDEEYHGSVVVPELLARRASAIAPERVSWVWPTWIPAGRLALISGRPSDGKSTLCLDLIARLTTGSPLPDGFRPERITCGVLSAEDDAADTLVPRLHAAGADLDRVLIVGALRDHEGLERPWMLPDNVLSLEELVRREEITLVVVDPLAAFTSSRIDGHRDSDVRRMLVALASMAERTRCAVIAVRHFRKGGASDARDAGGGSVAYTAASRIEIIVGADPHDPSGRVMAVGKSNLAAYPASLAFRLVADDQWDCARIRWDGATSVTAAQLTSEPPTAEARSELDDAVTFLTEALSDGPQPAATLKRQSEAAGISYRTLRRAKDKLDLRSRKTGTGGAWMWSTKVPIPAEQGVLTPQDRNLGHLGHLPSTHTQTNGSLSRETPQGVQRGQGDGLGWLDDAPPPTDGDVDRFDAEDWEDE